MTNKRETLQLRVQSILHMQVTGSLSANLQKFPHHHEFFSSADFTWTQGVRDVGESYIRKSLYTVSKMNPKLAELIWSL